MVLRTWPRRSQRKGAVIIPTAMDTRRAAASTGGGSVGGQDSTGWSWELALAPAAFARRCHMTLVCRALFGCARCEGAHVLGGVLLGKFKGVLKGTDTYNRMKPLSSHHQISPP